MNRASSMPASRATERLLLANRPAPETCECDQATDLQRRAEAAKPFIESAIRKLVEIASSPTSAAGVALGEIRRALSCLENDE